jgi:hypothetical protein
MRPSPIYINVLSPPLRSMARAYDLGSAVGHVVDAMPSDKRIAFLATGRLSHWSPVQISDAPKDDSFLQRMKRYQIEGKQVAIEGKQVALEDPGLYFYLAKYKIKIKMVAKEQWFLFSGCVEADVVAHARACLADGEPRRLVYRWGAAGRADHAGRRRGAPPAAADGGAPARLATDGIRRQCDEPAKLPPDAGVFLRDYEHPFRLLVVGHDPPRWR